MTTLLQLKNRILSIVDQSSNFANNIDSDNLTNICNDAQLELFKLLYNCFGEDIHQSHEDYIIQPNDGYLTFNSLTTTFPYVYFTNVPLAIFRVDFIRQNSRIPMKRFSIANEILSEESKSWQNSTPRYDWRGRKIYFNPINIDEETVRVYILPRPAIISSNTDEIEWLVDEHIELATIIGAMKIMTKAETPTTELQRQYDQYILRLKTMPTKDFGQSKYIQDVHGQEDWVFTGKGYAGI